MTKPLKRPPTKGTRRGNGVGKGEGWGGPAKGFAKTEGPKFEPGNKAAVGRRPPDEERIEWRKQKAWEMENVLDQLAQGAEREETRATAAARLHAICDGAPVARQQQLGADGKPTSPVLPVLNITIESPKPAPLEIEHDDCA